MIIDLKLIKNFILIGRCQGPTGFAKRVIGEEAEGTLFHHTAFKYQKIGAFRITGANQCHIT